MIVASVLFCSGVILVVARSVDTQRFFKSLYGRTIFFGVLALSVVIDFVGFLFRWLSWWMSGVYYSVSGLQWHFRLSPLFFGLASFGLS